MKLIVGLGNPGTRYVKSRHNVGFRVLDALADKLNVTIDKNDFFGVYCRACLGEEDIILLKPSTFMNLSGQSVQAISSFFKIAPSEILIVFDDMAIVPGHIRLRLSGSSGGHNGMKNIIEMLGTQDIKRIRVGIGEPQVGEGIDYVLGKPSPEEQVLIDEAVAKAVEAIVDYLKTSFHHAMSKFN